MRAHLLAAATVGCTPRRTSNDPDEARSAINGILGLPGWAIVGIVAAIGLVVFYLGLKIEADWPEALGALMISGAVLSAEVMIGLDTFKLFGMALMPYFIPLMVFVILFGVGLVKSK